MLPACKSASCRFALDTVQRRRRARPLRPRPTKAGAVGTEPSQFCLSRRRRRRRDGQRSTSTRRLCLVSGAPHPTTSFPAVLSESQASGARRCYPRRSQDCRRSDVATRCGTARTRSTCNRWCPGHETAPGCVALQGRGSCCVFCVDGKWRQTIQTKCREKHSSSGLQRCTCGSRVQP